MRLILRRQLTIPLQRTQIRTKTGMSRRQRCTQCRKSYQAICCIDEDLRLKREEKEEGGCGRSSAVMLDPANPRYSRLILGAREQSLRLPRGTQADGRFLRRLKVYSRAAGVGY